MPTLSVIIPNYNHAQYLGDALAAILTQSRPADEVIVIDDASTDNSREIIAEFAGAYPNLRPVYNVSNLGVVPNLNIGLDMAHGDFVCFASADDCILPGFFEKSLAALEAFPNADMVCCDPVTFRHGCESEMERKRLPLGDQVRFITGDELVWKMKRSRKFSIAGYTVLVRRQTVLDVGGFITDLRWTCDWFMLLVVAFRRGLVYLPEGLASFRITRGSYHMRGMRDWEQQKSSLLALVKLLDSREYADVRGAFVESGVMAVIGPSIRRLASENKEARALLKPWVGRRILWHQIRGFAADLLSPAVKRTIKSLLG